MSQWPFLMFQTLAHGVGCGRSSIHNQPYFDMNAVRRMRVAYAWELHLYMHDRVVDQIGYTTSRKQRTGLAYNVLPSSDSNRVHRTNIAAEQERIELPTKFL